VFIEIGIAIEIGKIGEVDGRRQNAIGPRTEGMVGDGG
jgi:hypothetical protein